MVVFLLSWVCVDVIGAVFIYFIIYWMGLTENDVSILLGIIFVTAVLVLPLWVLISKWVGKKAAYVIGMSFWAVVMSLAFFLRPGVRNWFLYLFCFLAGFGVSTAHVLPWSMIIDCVDIDEYRTGARREGMYTGFTLFAQKLASSVALLLVGSFLGWAGYVANTVQKESALIAIRVLLGPVPAVLLILSIYRCSPVPDYQGRPRENQGRAGPKAAEIGIREADRITVSLANKAGSCMVNSILLYTGSIIIVTWGIAHVVPTRGVVAGFGKLSRDNARIITMEWIAEGLTLVFIGAPDARRHTRRGQAQSRQPIVVYRGCALMLAAMAGLTLATGARTKIIPIKVCPIVKAAVAILFVVGSAG